MAIETQTDTTVARTILTQLGRSVGRITLMIGAHSFTARPNGVSFCFKAKSKNSSNALRVTLDPSDTYTVEFLRVHGGKLTTKKIVSDVYCDQLTELFERETGLYLSI